MTSDAALRSGIEEELDFEPSLDATGIGVAVKEGVATLTGHVSSYAQKVAAERAVSRVKGLRAVAEEMIVRLPLSVRHDHDEVALRAANVLSWTLNIPDDTVHGKVEKGWVTLTGDVDWQYQRQSAKLAVCTLGGVMGVSNTINIRPHATVKDVRAHITQALRRNAELESSGIMVLVEGGKITLSGRVKALHERRTAENAAWGISSVTEVVDNLIVA
jgi:osmotically-inducible protein OsmY